MTVRANDKENDVVLIPPVHGSYRVKVFYDGTPVSGGPMGFEVNPEPTSKVIGPPMRNDASVGIEYVVKVAAINCTLNIYQVVVKGPSGPAIASFNMDPSGNDVGITSKFNPQVGSVNANGVQNGVYDFKFTPKQPGDHTMFFFCNRNTLPGSPVTIQVAPSLNQSVTYGTTQVVNRASSARGIPSSAPMGGLASSFGATTISPRADGGAPTVIGAVGGAPSYGGPQVIGAAGGAPSYGGGPQVIGAAGGAPYYGGGPQVIGAVGGGPSVGVAARVGAGPQVIGAVGGGPQVIGAVGGGPQMLGLSAGAVTPVATAGIGLGASSDRPVRSSSRSGTSSKKSGGKSGSSSTRKKK